MRVRLRIQERIVIPFALVALATASIAAFAARTYFSRNLESRLVTQIESTAGVLGQSDFALNAVILRSARQLSGVDVVTYTSSGQVLATTLGVGAHTRLALLG